MKVTEILNILRSKGDDYSVPPTSSQINEFGDRITPSKLTERDVRFITADVRYPLLARWFSIFFYFGCTLIFLSIAIICLILIKSLIYAILICSGLLAANAAFIDLIYRYYNNFKLMHHQKEQEKTMALSRVLTRCSTPILFSEIDLLLRFKKASCILVSHFSDGCYIDFANGASLAIGAICHKNKEKENGIKYIREKYPPNDKNPVLQVFKTGIPKIINDIKFENFAYDVGHLNLLNMYFFKSVICVPIMHNNIIYGTITVGRDVVARVFTEEDLHFLMEFANHAGYAVHQTLLFDEAKKAIEFRDDFISIASHELRTPVGVVYMSLQSILRSIGSEPAAPIIKEKILSAINRTKYLISLLDRLLDSSKIQDGKIDIELEDINASDFLKETILKFEESLGKEKPVLILNFQENIFIRADPLRLEQIIQNLLSNAVKYAGNGSIEVCLLQKKDNKCNVTIQDHGPGIPSDKLKSIFNRFERVGKDRTIQGLGLGLWICKNILEQMGGKVEVESEVGLGCKFIVELEKSAISKNIKSAIN
jgi:signal transduction histidine kinase